MDEDDEEEEEEEEEDPEDDPDVQDIRWFWCEDSMWTWAVLSASSQTGKISLGGGVRLRYPVTDSGLIKVKGAHTLSLFPSGENFMWGQSKSCNDEGPIYYNREKLDGETNQLKECLLCKNTIASGFNQLKYIPFLYL